MLCEQEKKTIPIEGGKQGGLGHLKKYCMDEAGGD